MTRTFTAAEMEAIADKLQCVFGRECEKDRSLCIQCKAQAMLRQAAAGPPPSDTNYQACDIPALEVSLGLRHPDPLPAAAGPKRCGTCRHWNTGKGQQVGTGWRNGHGCEAGIVGQFMSDRGGIGPVKLKMPADGSGFCHLHEAKP